jgi:hypothetical protein
LRAGPRWSGRLDFGAALAARLGIPVPTPGHGIPAAPPFLPKEPGEVVPLAEAARAHCLELLGSGPFDFGPRLDWHLDIVSGYRWPPAHVSRFSWRAPNGADIRVPWELGRFLHVGPLLDAYLLSGDEMWAREVIDQVEGFIRDNPMGFGVQWVSPMDVAIRALNWSYALVVLAAGPHLPEMVRDRWLAALWAHGRYVRANLSWNPHSPGNHYTSELTGLLHVGLVFGWTVRGRRWARYAAHRLRREMRRQVHPSGANWEVSTNYHRLVTECFAQAAVALQRTSLPLGLPPDPEFDRRLAAMLAYVDGYTRPDGAAPLVGDADDGHLLGMNRPAGLAPDRHRASLGVYRQAEDEGTRPSSAAWPDAGFYALRGDRALVFVRCGPVGLRGRGAHDHADQLAIDVTLSGVPLFVDPGTYVYTRDPDARRAFRSTAAHNTVMVDGADQAVFSEGTLFEVDVGAPARVTTWDVTVDATVFSGVHEGYRRLPLRVTHRRQVRLAADGAHLEVLDRLEGDPGEHTVVVTFQCAPGASVQVLKRRTATACVNAGGRRFEVSGAVPAGLALSVDEGAVSRRYGVRVRAPRIRFTGRVRVPLETRFDITVKE